MDVMKYTEEDRQVALTFLTPYGVFREPYPIIVPASQVPMVCS